MIEQAKGIIANTRGISPDAAFDITRAYARAHQARLNAVALAIINAGPRV